MKYQTKTESVLFPFVELFVSVAISLSKDFKWI